MITAGIDVGNKYTKVVIIKDGAILGRGMAMSGFNRKEAADEAFAKALSEAGLNAGDIQYVMATGADKAEVTFAGGSVTDVGAASRGAIFFFPNTRTVVDVGAEKGRAVKTDERAKVIDFAVNEKCAAGAGSFVEAMARALEIPMESMGELSLQSNKAVPMNAQCAVFAESEVVSLIHAKTPKADIAKAIHDAIAGRVISMVRRVGLETDMVLVGGVARNVGFVRAMEEGLEVKAFIPEDPEFVCAVGAALAAAEKVK